MRQGLPITTALLAMSLVLAGCGDAAEKEKKQTNEFSSSVELAEDYDPDGHFSFGYPAFAEGWDPIDSVNTDDMMFWAPVYDTLLYQTPDGEVVPRLATDFQASDDLTSMTLTLQEGLTFADGTPLDADAAKFTLDRHRSDESKIKAELSQVTGVEVIDPLTIKINVDGGLGSLAVALASRSGVMTSPTAAQAGTLKTEPVGIGGYRVAAQAPGGPIDYEKVDGYWDPEAQRVATMTYKLITDDQTRYNALVTGELDAARINPDQLDDAEKAGVKVVARESARFTYLAINTAFSPLDDPEVRKALNMAIDRKAIAEGLYDGHCTPQIQPFHESSPAYSEKVGDGLDTFPYDPEAAKKILEDKGITDLTITTVSLNLTIYVKLAEVIQEQLKDIGITVTVKPLPTPQMVQEFTVDKSAELATSGYGSMNDPNGVKASYLAPTGPFNPGGEPNTDIVKYATEGAAALEPEDRAKSYAKMMDAWVENPPNMVPICMIHQATGMQPDVSNITQTSGGSADLRGVAVGKR